MPRPKSGRTSRASFDAIVQAWQMLSEEERCEAMTFRDHSLIARIIEALQTLQARHEACIAAGFKLCTDDPFKDSVLLGDILSFEVTGRRHPDSYQYEIQEKTCQMHIKKAFLHREDIFDQLKVILPDLFVSSRRVLLPQPHWKRLWQTMPKSFEQLEQQLAMTLEQAFWAMDLDAKMPADVEPTHDTLISVPDEAWMDQHDNDERIRAASARLTLKDNKNKKKHRRSNQAGAKCKQSVDEALPASSDSTSTGCSSASLGTEEADDGKQLPDQTLSTYKHCTEQTLSETDGQAPSTDNHCAEHCLAEPVADECNADSVDNTQGLELTTQAMTPDLTAQKIAQDCSAIEVMLNDENDDMKSISSTRPSENDLQELDAQEMFMLSSVAPMEVPIPVMCCKASNRQHGHLPEHEFLLSHIFPAFRPPPGLERDETCQFTISL